MYDFVQILKNQLKIFFNIDIDSYFDKFSVKYTGIDEYKIINSQSGNQHIFVNKDSKSDFYRIISITSQQVIVNGIYYKMDFHIKLSKETMKMVQADIQLDGLNIDTSYEIKLKQPKFMFNRNPYYDDLDDDTEVYNLFTKHICYISSTQNSFGIERGYMNPNGLSSARCILNKNLQMIDIQRERLPSHEDNRYNRNIWEWMVNNNVNLDCYGNIIGDEDLLAFKMKFV